MTKLRMTRIFQADALGMIHIELALGEDGESLVFREGSVDGDWK